MNRLFLVLSHAALLFALCFSAQAQQSQDRKTDRSHHSAECPGAGGQGHQIILDFGLPILD